MTRALIVRFSQYAVVLLVALVLNFALPRLAPGDPLGKFAVEATALSPEDRAALMHAYGLDGSPVEQFAAFMARLAGGDLGTSLRTHQPVSELVMGRIPRTLLLAGLGLIVATGLAVPLAVYSALHRGRRREVGTTTVFIVLQSMPAFWIGMVFIGIFSSRLRLLPSYGYSSAVPQVGTVNIILDVAAHLIMPLTVLILVTAPSMYVTTRSAMLGVLQEDFIATAYAKGLSQRVVLFRHAFRNALGPVLAVFALHLGFVVGGAVVIETVFSYPGIGRLLFEAVGARDYPVLQAGFLIIAVSVIVANLLADVVHGLVDPRVRLAHQ